MTSPAHGNSSAPRLVILGCGYVGTAVAEFALARGVRVTAVTRNSANAPALRAAGIETVVADVAGDTWYDHVPAAPDYLLDCVSAGGRGLEGYRRSYLEGMQSILHWCRQYGPAGTLAYTSSTSVYPQYGGVLVDEEASTDAPSSDRAEILTAAEQQLMRSQGACRRWFVLRLAGIYGPGRHHLLDQVKAGDVSGLGSHRLNLVHRDDIVSAIWTCFTAPADVASDVFNVVDDHPEPKRDVVEWLAARLGRPVPSFSGMPADGRRAITPDRIVSNAKLKTVLGWSPRYRSYRDGYEAILAP